MTDSKSEIRKQLMIMVALVLVIDVVAIAIFKSMGIEQASRDRRALFTGAWTLVSLLVVLNGLYRIRIARRAGARPRR
jgi:hypothetical protein